MDLKQQDLAAKYFTDSILPAQQQKETVGLDPENRVYRYNLNTIAIFQ